MATRRTDPASEIVTAAVTSLLDVFDPEQDFPPVGGGTDTVRVFAGDGAPLDAWDAHSAGSGCKQPFLWVRSMRRYRSRVFPAPTISTDCDLPRVIAVEFGVGRCAYVPDGDRIVWSKWAEESQTSSDDSWRIEVALCQAMGRLRNDDAERAVGTDTISPYGPEGGVLAWTGVLYATYD